MYVNIEEIVREPLLSQAKEIAEEQNMTIKELLEYALRRYIEDIYGIQSVDETEVEDQEDSHSDSDEDSEETSTD